MRVRMTRAEVERGIPGSLCQCPVALAIRKAVDPGVYVSVGAGTAFLVHDDNTAVLDLPQTVSDWTYDFDVGRNMKPMSFNLPIPGRFRRAR